MSTTFYIWKFFLAIIIHYISSSYPHRSKFFDELNAAEVCYPSTDMLMTYKLMSKDTG